MIPANLNDGERHCLQLLAQGYDIKGIAAECGLSVNAVNERLRSARAKLGTTSSRAAARLLAQGNQPTQKIWDNKSGIIPGIETRQPVDVGRRLWPLGVLAMLVAVALAAEHDCPVVATNDVRFLAPDQFDAHEARVGANRELNVTFH